MKRIKKKKPYPLKTSREVRTLSAKEAEKLTETNSYAWIGVPLSEREGVFIHSFMCNKCGLHFNVYSWKADMHTAANTYCPECGQRGDYRHFRAIINESTKFTVGGNEIYKHCSYPGAEIMSDSK